MKSKATQKKPGFDWFGNLARYIEGYLGDNGLQAQRVMVLTDAPYPLLPQHYAVVVVFLRQSGPWREYCAWAQPEGYIDLMDSVDRWLEKITAWPNGSGGLPMG